MWQTAGIDIEGVFIIDVHSFAVVSKINKNYDLKKAKLFDDRSLAEQFAQQRKRETGVEHIVVSTVLSAFPVGSFY